MSDNADSNKLSTTAGVTTVYSSTLLRNVGFNPKQAALLNAPSGVVSIVSTLLAGYLVRSGGRRWIWIPVCISPAIVGGALMSFVRGKGGVLSGVWSVNTTVATLPMIYQWLSANVAGHTKRPFAMALLAGSFNVGNIIGPQTFQARDAPQYIPAKVTVFCDTRGRCCLRSAPEALLPVGEPSKRQAGRTTS